MFVASTDLTFIYTHSRSDQVYFEFVLVPPARARAPPAAWLLFCRIPGLPACDDWLTVHTRPIIYVCMPVIQVWGELRERNGFRNWAL